MNNNLTKLLDENPSDYWNNPDIVTWRTALAKANEEIARLCADLAEAREALKPIAHYAHYFENMPDDYNGHVILTAGQCRRAALSVPPVPEPDRRE